MDHSFLSAFVLLLVLDPFGSLPVFKMILAGLKRYFLAAG